jgi:hypothetical protein
MLLGGSTAGAAAFVDAFHTGRLAGDAPGTTDPPTRYTTAAAAYNPPFDSGGPRGRAWGPGSLTRVDPDDDQTLWTIQQHVSAINAWGTRIARVRGPGPATPTSAPGLVAIGEGARTLTLTGAAAGDSAFFDPGPGFPRRFAVTIGCGLTVTGARVISATTAEVTLTSAGATKGSCPVTAINPDGQAATSPVGLVETDTRPVAGDAARTTPVGTALTGRVPASDADGDPTTATLVDGPAHGTLELAPSGSYT